MNTCMRTLGTATCCVAIFLAVGCGNTEPTDAQVAAVDAAEAEKEKRNEQMIDESLAPKAEAKKVVMADAPNVATLEEGGFATEPAYVDTFDPGWKPADHQWRVATWKQNGTQMSPERCEVNADGHLVQTVTAGEPYQGGSMQSSQEFGYGRWVARVKPSAVPGVLNSIFTKDWDDLTTEEPENDGSGAEVDIEFLTYTFGEDTGKVHTAIHLATLKPHYWKDVPLDFNPSDDFHEWGFDILPDRVVWHVDGKQINEWKYTDEHKVNEGYEMFFNSWTRDRWINGPPESDAHYHIDWVKFYPYEGE